MARKSPSRRKSGFSEFIDKLLRCLEDSSRHYIQINSIATETGVEKRRLYDLMNVLVACGVCIKTDTHTYCWEGLARARAALAQNLREIELRSLSEPIDKLFLLPDSPPIGTLATYFVGVFLFTGARRLNIRDAALLMSPDEDHSKPVLRRLYLVAYLLEHIGILRHAQCIGEYELDADIDEIASSVLAGLARDGEFPPDTIEYRMNRLDGKFLRRLHEQRREEFERIARMRADGHDDAQTPSLACDQIQCGVFH